VLTAEIVALNVALVVPASTVTVAGTTTAELLLERLTDWPAVPAAALNVIVQLSVPAPVIDLLTQLSAFTATDPVSALLWPSLTNVVANAHPVRLASARLHRNAASTVLLVESEWELKRQIRKLFFNSGSLLTDDAARIEPLPPKK
jgi:hypothetical protein